MAGPAAVRGFARKIARILLAAWIAVAGLSCDRTQGLTDQDIADNNRGVALMGHFDYHAAHDVFEDLASRHPEWLDAQVNLAIATLNRQEEGDDARALEILEGVLRQDSDHVRANYVSGLLRLYLGETAASLANLRQVSRADPDDAYAAYFIGQDLLQLGSLEEAVEQYRRAIELDPYLRSAYYGAGLALRRLGRADEAREMLADYERFDDNPRARLAEFRYSRMGPKAEALAIGREDSKPARRPRGELFASAADIQTGGGGAPARLTAADIDGDGRLDLFRVSTSDSLVLLADEHGGFRPAADHALSGVGGVVAALWGDVDNDGSLDVYLCRLGPNQLWMGAPGGGWTESGEASGTNDPGYCSDAGLVDADHDGDLDIFLVNSNGPDELFSNNLDGRFRRLAEGAGITGSAGAGQFLPADLDGDRDVDLVVVRESGSDVWTNDRLWQYRPAPGFDLFRSAPLLAAVTGDRDADGRAEIYTVDSDGGLSVWVSEDGQWQPSPVGQVDGGAPYLALTDFDGDGRAELLAGSRAGLVIFRGEEDVEAVVGGEGIAGPALVFNGDAGRGPSLVAPLVSGLRSWDPGQGRFGFLGISASGKEDLAESMRSNRSGIGTRISLRNLDRWSITDTFDRLSTPGQSLQPVLMGLAGRQQADFVALDWSDGVFQTELDLDAGRIHYIAETQRQLSSCPVVFAWDGQRFAFVSDVLGVGGLGFFVAPGIYATPRPWERFLMPAGLPVPHEGRYLIKISEPMEENAYLDSVALHVVDLPPGWDMAIDERMGTGPPAVTGRPIFFATGREVIAAFNDRGDEVTRTILHADRVAAPPGILDERFIGRLRRPHALILEFDGIVNPEGSLPALVADGWIEYPYSQTVFAAWQAGATYDPPDLEARTADGTWHLVYADFGYPAGMPREMALPLADLPAETVALRLTSNLEIYWDRLRLVYEDEPPGIHAIEIAPATARLAKTGFPLRRTGPQRLPDYDYSVRSTFWDARYLEGYYTKLGPVEPLLAGTDDAVAIIGPGEEVHLEFAAPPAPPEGWTRRVTLDARGWAKDMDLYTRDGETVGPLPVRDSAGPAEATERQDMHDRFNVRYQAGR